jgi:hypothetical protein
MGMMVDGSKDGDHNKESQRRSCDARLLGKGGAYAIITKAHCPNSGADAVRGTRCWWASLHTPLNEPRAHRRWVWAASDLLIGRWSKAEYELPARGEERAC